MVALIAPMDTPVRALLREKGTPYDSLGLADPKWSDDEFRLQMAHPILINRPIVVWDKGVRQRPSEAVFDLLQQPVAHFLTEDGEVVSPKPAGLRVG
jgi:arsenate reductase